MNSDYEDPLSSNYEAEFVKNVAELREDQDRDDSDEDELDVDSIVNEEIA